MASTDLEQTDELVRDLPQATTITITITTGSDDAAAVAERAAFRAGRLAGEPAYPWPPEESR